jgi:hypothetical protein
VLAQDWRQILQDFGPLRKLFGDSWTNFVSLARPPKAGAGPSTGASAGGSAAGAGTGTGTGEVATLIAFMSAEADKNREMQLKLMGLFASPVAGQSAAVVSTSKQPAATPFHPSSSSAAIAKEALGGRHMGLQHADDGAPSQIDLEYLALDMGKKLNPPVWLYPEGDIDRTPIEIVRVSSQGGLCSTGVGGGAALKYTLAFFTMPEESQASAMSLTPASA